MKQPEVAVYLALIGVAFFIGGTNTFLLHFAQLDNGEGLAIGIGEFIIAVSLLILATFIHATARDEKAC